MLTQAITAFYAHAVFFYYFASAGGVYNVLFSVVGAVLAAVELIAAGLHLKMHIYMLTKNLTAVEVTKHSFNWSRMTHFKIDHQYLHPFHREDIISNLKEALGSNPLLWILPIADSNQEKKLGQGYHIRPNGDACKKLSELEEQVENIVSQNLREAGLII